MAENKNTAEAAPSKPEAPKAAAEAASTISPAAKDVLDAADVFLKNVGAAGLYALKDLLRQGSSKLDTFLAPLEEGEKKTKRRKRK